MKEYLTTITMKRSKLAAIIAAINIYMQEEQVGVAIEGGHGEPSSRCG